MRRSICALFLGLSAFLSPALARASAASDAAAYADALTSNLDAASGFLADSFAKGLAFAVGSQGFSPVQAKSLLGFNIGLGGGATLTPLDKAALKAQALNNGTDLGDLAAGLPDTLPLPLGVLNAHVGLPKMLFFESLDLGARLTKVDLNSADLSAKMDGLGFELRGNVFEAGLVSPLTLTLGLGWERLRTQLDFAKDTGAISGSFGASSYSGDTRNTASLDSDLTLWDLKASVSRKFLFFTPYAGAAFDLISGDTRFRSAQTGALTFVNGGSFVLDQGIEGQAVKAAPAMDLRLAAGFELSFFALYFELGGEYGVVSAGSGGHAQLGLAF